MAKEIVDIEKHFWSCADRSGGGNSCWNWSLFKNKKGYGRVKIKGKPVYAHRYAAEISGLKIPDGHFVCHRCDNPSCINPAHLFIGTASDNMQDCKSKGRLSPPPKWDRPPKSKLTPDQIKEMRSLHHKETYKSIAKMFSVGEATVWRVLSKTSWGDV